MAAWWEKPLQGAAEGAAAGAAAGGPAGAVGGAVAGGAYGAATGKTPSQGLFGAGANAATGAYDWLNKVTSRPARYAEGYQPDPNAFRDPYADANRANYAAGAAGAANRQGPTEFRQGQQDYIAMLQAQARGEGPSVAREQLAAGTERNINSALALMASGRGVNAATAARMAGQNLADINRGASRDSAILRQQEMLDARNQLGGALSSARGMDLNQQAQNDSMVQYYTSLGYSNDQAQAAAARELEALRVQEALGRGGINATYALGREQGTQNLLGAGLNAAGSAGAAAIPLLSDERAKKDVQPGAGTAYEFLDKLNPRTFSYRDPGAPGAAPGAQLGVMAQDMGASAAGAPAVVSTPAGKGLDPNRSLGAALAGMAGLHDRLKRLESGGQPATQHQLSPPPARTAPAPEGAATRAARKTLEWLRSGPGAVLTGGAPAQGGAPMSAMGSV